MPLGTLLLLQKEDVTPRTHRWGSGTLRSPEEAAPSPSCGWPAREMKQGPLQDEDRGHLRNGRDLGRDVQWACWCHWAQEVYSPGCSRHLLVWCVVWLSCCWRLLGTCSHSGVALIAVTPPPGAPSEIASLRHWGGLFQKPVGTDKSCLRISHRTQGMDATVRAGTRDGAHVFCPASGCW